MFSIAYGESAVESVGPKEFRNSQRSTQTGSGASGTENCTHAEESATHVFVEPVDRALPGQIGRGFVIPFRTLAQIGCAAAS